MGASSFNVLNKIFHRQKLLGIMSGNLEFELLLNRHDKLNGVEVIGVQVTDELRVCTKLPRLGAQLLAHNRQNSTSNPRNVLREMLARQVFEHLRMVWSWLEYVRQFHLSAHQ
jgi:hypothetical protein